MMNPFYPHPYQDHARYIRDLEQYLIQIQEAERRVRRMIDAARQAVPFVPVIPPWPYLVDAPYRKNPNTPNIQDILTSIPQR